MASCAGMCSSTSPKMYSSASGRVIVPGVGDDHLVVAVPQPVLAHVRFPDLDRGPPRTPGIDGFRKSSHVPAPAPTSTTERTEREVARGAEARRGSTAAAARQSAARDATMAPAERHHPVPGAPHPVRVEMREHVGSFIPAEHGQRAPPPVLLVHGDVIVVPLPVVMLPGDRADEQAARLEVGRHVGHHRRR